MTTVPANQVIKESLTQVQLRAEESQIEIINETTKTTLPEIWTDPVRLRQVLLNLLSNAIKYNQPGGSITFFLVELADQMLRINVTDTGKGIAEEMQKIFSKPLNA